MIRTAGLRARAFEFVAPVGPESALRPKSFHPALCFS